MPGAPSSTPSSDALVPSSKAVKMRGVNVRHERFETCDLFHRAAPLTVTSSTRQNFNRPRETGDRSTMCTFKLIHI